MDFSFSYNNESEEKFSKTINSTKILADSDLALIKLKVKYLQKQDVFLIEKELECKRLEKPILTGAKKGQLNSDNAFPRYSIDFDGQVLEEVKTEGNRIIEAYLDHFDNEKKRNSSLSVRQVTLV